MSVTIEINLGELNRVLERTPHAFYNGSVRAVQDILNDWQRASRDDAPIDSGELRRKIQTELDAKKAEIIGTISNNVYHNGFNYAYWQHDVRGGGGLKYIEKNVDEAKWKKQIEDEVKAELRKAGW